MRTVLVLEDDVNLAELYREELEDEGYSVVLAYTGAAALELVNARRPKVIVMDLHFRNATQDAESTLDALQSRCPGTPVVINTAYLSPADDLRARAVQALVRKNSDLTELKTRICECLHLHTLVPMST